MEILSACNEEGNIEVWAKSPELQQEAKVGDFSAIYPESSGTGW
jgi:hypothetical protein